MIGNQVKGRSFRGCLNYLWSKVGAEHIGGNMSGRTPQQLAAEFQLSQQQNPNVQRVVYHASLSIAKHERLDNDQWSAIADDYLKGMGFSHNQYIVVRHKDREHDHIHIVASRVRLDGTCVHDGWDYRRSESIIRQLEQAYKLEPVTPSWEVESRAPTKGELKYYERTRQPSVKTKLQKLARDALSKSATPEAYMQRLQQAGVEVKTRKERSGKVSGISYQVDGVAISGTNLGRAYTWPGIQRQTQKREQRQQPDDLCHSSRSPKARDSKPPAQTISQQISAQAITAKKKERQNLIQQSSTRLGDWLPGSALSEKALSAIQQDFSAYEQTLIQLHTWQKAARAVRQSKDYLSQIKTIVTDFKAGQSLSSKTLIAMRKDLKAYEQGISSMQRWQQAAKELGYSAEQCQRIKKLAEIYKQGYPLPELAAMAMHEDLGRYEQQQSQLRVQEKLEQIQQEQRLGNRALIDRDQDNEYEL